MKKLLFLLLGILVSVSAEAQTPTRDGTSVAGNGTFSTSSYTTSSVTVLADSICYFVILVDTDISGSSAGYVRLDSSGGTNLTEIAREETYGNHLLVFETAPLSAGAHTIVSSPDNNFVGSTYNTVFACYKESSTGTVVEGNCASCGLNMNEFVMSVTADSDSDLLFAATWNGWTDDTYAFQDGGVRGIGFELGRAGNLLVFDANGPVSSGAHTIGTRQNVTNIYFEGVTFNIVPGVEGPPPAEAGHNGMMNGLIN